MPFACCDIIVSGYLLGGMPFLVYRFPSEQNAPDTIFNSERAGHARRFLLGSADRLKSRPSAWQARRKLAWLPRRFQAFSVAAPGDEEMIG